MMIKLRNMALAGYIEVLRSLEWLVHMPGERLFQSLAVRGKMSRYEMGTVNLYLKEYCM